MGGKTAMNQDVPGEVEIQDAVLWPMHVKGAPKLQARLLALAPEEVIVLRVAGKLTAWTRMRTGKDGRPVLGLKPCDAKARDLWRSLYPARKGDTVTISEAE